MNRLRHPIRAIREPFGTAGLIVAFVALIAALGGTALAAAKLNSTQKKEVEKIAKKYAGKPGANGTNGANGAAGAKGDAGAAGGAGANGTSVTGVAILVGNAECASKAGGVKYTSASGSNAVCNGKDGTTGFTEKLPSGKTETGVWSMQEVPSATTPGTLSPMFLRTTISFPIPLASPIEASSIHVFEGSTFPPGCSGTVTEPLEQVTELKAAAGNLCVWLNAAGPVTTEVTAAETSVGNPENLVAGGAGTHGAVLTFPSAGEGARAVGVWAVTG